MKEEKEARFFQIVWGKKGTVCPVMRFVYMLSSPFVYLGHSIGRKYVGCVTGKERICKNNMNGSFRMSSSATGVAKFKFWEGRIMIDTS